MRFKDPVLIRILHTMRAVGGQPLAESDWQALLATERADFSVSADKPDVTGWYHTCYVWSIYLYGCFRGSTRISAHSAEDTLLHTGGGCAPELAGSERHRHPETLP